MTIGAETSPRRHHLVEPQTEGMALPVAEPANPCREALERHPLTGQGDPAVQRLVAGELLEHRPICCGDVRRIS